MLQISLFTRVAIGPHAKKGREGEKLTLVLLLLLLFLSADRVENVFQICHVSRCRKETSFHMIALRAESWGGECLFRPFLFRSFIVTSTFKELPAAHYGSRCVNLAALLEVMKSSCTPYPGRPMIRTNLAQGLQSYFSLCSNFKYG